jgi:hypothetical protein
MTIARLKPGAYDDLDLRQAEALALQQEIEHRALLQDTANLNHNRQLLAYRLNKLRREAAEGGAS